MSKSNPTKEEALDYFKGRAARAAQRSRARERANTRGGRSTKEVTATAKSNAANKGSGAVKIAASDPKNPTHSGDKPVWRGGRQVNPNYKPTHKQSPGTEGKRTTYRFNEFDRYNAKDQDPNKFKSKVVQKSGTLRDIKDLKKIKGAAQRRSFRTQKGLYLGKYYGPDQFKGDETKNKAWEKAGKPNVNSFLKRYSSK